MENIPGGWSLSREVVEVREEASGQRSRKLRMRLFTPQLAWIKPIKQRCQQVGAGGRPLGRWEAETAAKSHLGHALLMGISIFRWRRSPFLGWSRFAGDWAPPEDLRRLEVWLDLLKPMVHSDGWSESGREREMMERGEEIFLRQLFFCIINLTNKYVITHIKWNNLINILCPFLT